MEDWETTGVDALERTEFEMWYGGSKYCFQPVTTGYGEYYPYRDTCDKKGDPGCRNSTVLYYMTSLFPKEANTSLIIKYAGGVKDILRDTISAKHKLQLRKKDINCSGGNVYCSPFLVSV